MTTPSVWQRSVPFIQDGDPVKASVPNAPLQVLADRTAALKSIVDSLQAGEQLILRDAPVETSVSVGAVVYLKESNLRHDSALAQWQSLESSGGRLFPADSAVYTGVVTEKPHAGAAHILLGGFGVLDDSGLTGLFGTTSPNTGYYYLSSLNPGTVEEESPAMSVRVLQYVGGGVVRVFPPQSEPVTHTHRDYVLYEQEWLDATFFDQDIVPDGALFGYNFASANAIAQNLGESLLPAVGEASFIYLGGDLASGGSSTLPGEQCPLEGLHVSKPLILLDQNGIWWFGAASPTCNLEMTVTSADTKGEALIHTVENLTPDSLDITTVNGRVKVGDKAFELDADEDEAGHLAVKRIDGRTVYRGPMVEEIRAGAGIIATSSNPNTTGQQGTVSIRNAMFEGVYQAANLLNLNNAVTDVDSPYVFTLFPAGRTSSVTASLTLPNFGDLQYEMVLWAQFIAPGPGQAAPTVTDYVLTPSPAASGVTPVNQAASFGSFPGTINAGDLYLVESNAINVTAFSKGTVFFTLEASDPSAGLRMTNLGVRLIVLDS